MAGARVSEENLEILQWNARGISNNDSDLRALFTTHTPQIVAIQETWLKYKEGENNTPHYSCYNPYRMDRKIGNKKYGGILMLIRTDLLYNKKILKPYKTNNGILGTLEIQAITIKSNSQEIDIVNIYNPPSNNLTITEFKHYFSQINKNYFIVGDFNAHHHLWEP